MLRPVEPHPPAVLRLTPFLLGCCVLLALLASVGLRELNNVGSQPDFRSFYVAGYIARTQPHEIFDPELQRRLGDALVRPSAVFLPYYHPAYEALLYAPFTLLPYRAAYIAFLVGDGLLLLGVYLAMAPLLSGGWFARMPGVQLLLFVPVWIALVQGQDSLVFLLLACLAWRALARSHPQSAGWLLAMAMFRFQLAIPLAVLLAVRFGRRFWLPCVAGTVAVAALCLALTGLAGNSAWVAMLDRASLSAGHSLASQAAIGVYPADMANLRGLLYACVTRRLTAPTTLAIVAATSLLVLLVAALALRRHRETGVTVAIATLAAVLVSYHLNYHDLALLVLPLALLPGTTPHWLRLTAWATPSVVFLFAGINWCFLAAIPSLCLLAWMALPSRSPAASPGMEQASDLRPGATPVQSGTPNVVD